MNENEKDVLEKQFYRVGGYRTKKARLEKLDEGVFCAVDFGFGNVGFVITDEGVVVIDTTALPSDAEVILSEIRKLTDKPIKYLIYTHGHLDHVQGASVFKQAGATIIAHRNVSKRLDRYTKLNEHHYRINSLQYKQRFLEPKMYYHYPDISYDMEYTFEFGGKTFRLMHHIGETDDATVVYIPEHRVFFVGDFIVWQFPNIGNPQKVIRYELEWAEMLERILSLKPKAVAPGHSSCLLDQHTIQACLGDTAGVLRFLHEQCVSFINRGSSLEQALKEIQLPERFSKSPYLQQHYGCREFAMRGIFRRYTGWFDGNPSNLSPIPQNELYQVILELADRKKIENKIEELQSAGNLQMALHLLDLLLSGDSGNVKHYHQVKGQILEKLALAYNNLFFRNFFIDYAEREYRSAT